MPVDLALQLADRAVEAGQDLGALVALVHALVDDDAERFDEAEAFTVGGARFGRIAGALGRRIHLVDQGLDAPGHGLAFVRPSARHKPALQRQRAGEPDEAGGGQHFLVDDHEKSLPQPDGPDRRARGRAIAIPAAL